MTSENENEILENESGTWNVNFSCSYYVLEGNYGGLYPARRLICWYTNPNPTESFISESTIHTDEEFCLG